MTTINAKVFEVEKQNLNQTRFVSDELSTELAENELLLSIDKVALTANNISYGVAGDTLGYWRFFPAKEEQWGRIPAMGYATVMLSNHPDINVGERVWGFFPFASHVKVVAGYVSAGRFMDVSEHRKGLSPVYATLDRVSANPFYKEENEAYEMLLRGLYTTSWLVDDFMYDHQYFGAEQYLITSASSKTSIALAFAIKERGERKAIGLTSEANKVFVTGLNCYDQVISYQDLTELDKNKTSILVDMAGSNTLLTNIHQHFDAQLTYSCRIGATHHDELFAGGKLQGPEPIFFFAPTQLEKRSQDWGKGEVMKRIAESLLRYMQFGRQFLTIRHSTTQEALVDIYSKVLEGSADAAIGEILTVKVEN